MKSSIKTILLSAHNGLSSNTNYSSTLNHSPVHTYIQTYYREYPEKGFTLFLIVSELSKDIQKNKERQFIVVSK